MSENNKSYRLRTKIGVNENSPIEDKYLKVNLTNDIDSIDVMSLKIKQENAYKFHAADYGVVVGRAIANGGFGVPNVKVSVFIAASDVTKNDPIYNAIYPYTRVTQKNSDNIRYNLLPDVGDDDCYQAVGTFPNKRLVLDDDNYLEIYDTYYKFTTRTNNAGDYMIFGIPTGGQVLHFDVDLSDVGILSQKPRDMVFKGYNINQFENPNQFKADDNLSNLPQIISQDDSVYVYPFWGDEDENIIGITRHDIDINYKFEPTCVFIGSIVSDTNSNHISKKCIPTAGMGIMEDLITGPGTIEMIRKKQDGSVEQFNIQGTQLINNDGVWCYQIPMNLDYVMTDEYGNLVPSNDPTKGIATRTKVRFRFSMQDFENDSLNSFRAKVLVPNNPKNDKFEPDYVFGSFTEEESFRDLLWNNVYTVKSFIPRFQKGNGDNNRRFSGIKQCNYHGQNNPIPYNNMRINLSFQFVITCLIVKLLVGIVGIYNSVMTFLSRVFGKFPNLPVIRDIKNVIKTIDSWKNRLLKPLAKTVLLPFTILGELAILMERMARSLSCIYIDGSMCDTLEGAWYFAPGCARKGDIVKGSDGVSHGKDPYMYLFLNMFAKVEGKKLEEIDYSSSKSKTAGGLFDKQSIDSSNADEIGDEDNKITIYANDDDKTGRTYDYVISRGINYFLQCIEISLAQEFRVVQFDFYNDWINGMLYIPRWERSLKRKRKYFLFGKSRVEVRACNDGYEKRFLERKNSLTEQCGVSYKAKPNDNSIGTRVGCKSNKKYKCHKKAGRKQFRIFNDGGVVHSEITSSGLYAYYFRPCEYVVNRNSAKNRKINLFATDIVLLGSLDDCDLNGTPAFTNELTSTSYQLPSPLAHTDSSEEGYGYKAIDENGTIVVDEYGRFSGVFDMEDSILNPKDDGAVTEESGIDWGYTGPGQGVPNKPKTYTPGGHFLGISCVNAESNIKSCVNLKRVCEVGAWTSSRQEVFDGYDSAHTAHYVDIIPNGLISKDELSGGNFRKIFSTLNKNGLRTKVNDSGFTVYDFEYMSPDNFGGELLKYTRANYNEANPIGERGYLAKDGDVDEDGNVWGGKSESETLSLKPVRRSLEERDRDYMRFRLGLEGKTNNELQKKYLGNDDYGYYMPVYDNSFYFYFGLVPGSTALDEFHRQFFAECKHTMTTDDLRINIEMSYHDCKNVGNAFDGPIEISIFESGITFNEQHQDSLRIFSTAMPIKVVVDSKYSHVHKEELDEDAFYIDCTGWVENGRNVFDFEVGKHTIAVTDADGRSVTKLVEVVQQGITVCPEINGISFSAEDYIVNSTESLINGTANSRENLGGWFSFDWSNSTCEGNTALFSYKDLGGRNCGRGFDDNPTTSVLINDTGLTMLFVGKSHIIKIGNSFPDSAITEFDEFEGFTIYTGATSTLAGYHIFAGEEGNYDFYVLYKNGGDETKYPILIQDNIYIGEQPAIDFDVFREIIASEDDSPVTFRNPLIKIWSQNPGEWYTHLYDDDGPRSDQIWYIRKNMFYVLKGLVPGKDNDDYIEEFSNERDLNMNVYYPTSVGNVTTYIDNSPESILKIRVQNQTLGDNDQNGKVIRTFELYATGATTEGADLRAPMSRYGGGVFKFPIFYKPFYYKTVVWEGYGGIEASRANPVTYGQVHGRIFNGVVYDKDGKQVLGPTILNSKYNLDEYVNVATLENDFTVNRTGDNASKIEYTGMSEDDFTTFSDYTNKLVVTEGSPDVYESTYVPVEYSIETTSIGPQANWGLSLDMDFTATTYNTNFLLTFEDTDYEEIIWYWSPNMNLTYDTQKKLVETYDTDKLKDYFIVARGSSGNVPSSLLTGGTITVNIPLPSPDRTGHVAKIENGLIVAESIKRDSFVFSKIESEKGYLSSRNIIKDSLKVDYNYMIPNINTFDGHISAFLTVNETTLGGLLKGRIIKDKGRAVGSTQEGCGVIDLTIPVPFIDKKVKRDVGNNYERVIIKLKDKPAPNPVTGGTYDLINDMGYTFDYRGGKMYVQLSEPYSENGIVFDSSTVTRDEFTDKLIEYFRANGGWEPRGGGYNTIIDCEVILSAVDVGGEGDDSSDVLDNLTIKYKTQLTFRRGASEDSIGDD